jgi:hypothetical protein
MRFATTTWRESADTVITVADSTQVMLNKNQLKKLMKYAITSKKVVVALVICAAANMNNEIRFQKQQ